MKFDKCHIKWTVNMGFLRYGTSFDSCYAKFLEMESLVWLVGPYPKTGKLRSLWWQLLRWVCWTGSTCLSGNLASQRPGFDRQLLHQAHGTGSICMKNRNSTRGNSDLKTVWWAVLLFCHYDAECVAYDITAMHVFTEDTFFRETLYMKSCARQYYCDLICL